MELIQISDPGHALAKSLEELYVQAFPKEERKPIDHLYLHQHTNHSKVFAVRDKDHDFIGLAVVIYDFQVMIIEYLATVSHVRGNNYGGRILAALMEKFPDHHIVLEIEETKVPSLENELRMRRRKFYERNQFNFYDQTVSYFGVPLELMGTRDAIDYEDYIQPYKLTYGMNVNQDIYELPY